MIIDVVIPSKDRLPLLTQCIASVAAASREVQAGLEVRILILLSNCDESAAEELRVLASSLHPRTEVYGSVEGHSPAQARNLLLPKVTGDWVFFLDDDAQVPNLLFSKFVELTRLYPDADIMGGPNLTPLHSSLFQVAAGRVLASRFGSGPCATRYGSKPLVKWNCSELHLTSCNLFVRCSVAAKIQFPEQLVSNEENWVLQDLEDSDCRFLFHSSLAVWHSRRKDFRSFIRQIFTYGIGRGQSNRRWPRTFQWPLALPSLSILLSLFALTTGIGSSLFLVYAIALIFSTLRIGRQSGAVVAGLAGLLFPAVHIAYGVGLMRGWIRNG